MEAELCLEGRCEKHTSEVFGGHYFEGGRGFIILPFLNCQITSNLQVIIRL